MKKTRERGRRGEGAVWRRPRGGWCGSVDLGLDADGRRQRRWISGPTKAAVQAQILELRGAQATGQLPPSDRVTVREFLGSWLAVKATELAPSGHHEYAARVRRLILSTGLAGQRLQQLRKAHIDAWLSELQARGVSASSRADGLRVLKAALNSAVDGDLLAASPARKVKPPKLAAPKRPWLTGEQIQQLVAAVADAPAKLRAFAVTLVLTGVRIQELLALRWGAIDWKRGVIKIEHALIEVGKQGILEKEPKTEAGKREIAVAPLVLEALRALRDQRAEAGVVSLPTARVFTTTRGKAYRRAHAYRELWLPALRAARLPLVGFHAARRGHLTQLIQAGGDLRAVSARAGHTKVAFTLQVYAQTNAEADRRLAALSTAALGR